MVRSAARRACPLVLVLALLVAPMLPAPRRDCGQCPPGCPMHTQRLGCHHGGAMKCHRSGPAKGIRSACSQAPEPGAPASGSLRGVMPAPASSVMAFVARPARPSARVLFTQHVPEPATDPPRALPA